MRRNGRSGTLPADHRRELRPGRQEYSAPASMWRAEGVRFSSCWLLPQIQFQIGEGLPQPGQHSARFVYLSKSFPGDAEVSLGFSAALRSWIAQGGNDQALGFHALQCGVDAAHRYIPAAVRFEFAGYGHTVCVMAEMNDGEEEHELKLAEIASLCH